MSRMVALSSVVVKNFVKKRGADLVGIASIDSFDGALDKQKPTLYLPEAKSLISFGLRIPDGLIDNLPRTRRSYTASYHTINAKLNDLALGLTLFLEDEGYKSVYYPASRPYDAELCLGDISHRHVALKAGLGEVSYSGLLLTAKYGPRVRFNTVVTKARLKPDPPYRGSRLCKHPDCDRCVKICPPQAQATTQVEYLHPIGRVFDKQSCLQYMSETLKGLVCGMCIKVCPIGK